MIKCKMKMSKYMYPKEGIESGDYAIFVATVTEYLSDEKPVEHPVFKTVSVKGCIPVLEIGEEYTFTLGKAETNKFGTSYELTSVTKDIDINNKAEVEDFLRSICGNKIANELMKLDNPYQLLLDRNNNELLKVKGIGESKLEQIYYNLDLFGDKSYAFSKLEPLGISRTLISKMCNKLGGAYGAVDVCFNNPYKLIDRIDGIGFIKADEIAAKCGYADNNVRIKYAILHVLETHGESGRSYLTSTQLLEELKRFTSIDFMNINNIIQKLIDEKRILLSEDGLLIALTKYIKLEQEIALRIFELANAKNNIEIPENWMEIVEKIEEKQGWKHTDEQIGGIETVLKENVVVIKGLAGTGKSTVVNAMAEVLKDYHIEMCCLSAKAAQRLREVTGYDAKTIHRLLGLGVGTQIKEDCEIYADIIILDEASMVNGTLFLKLIKAISLGSKLIILGDNGQLTSIGNCSVFNDLLQTDKIAVVELTKIHRQAQKSAIITKSIDIRKQIPIVEKSFTGHRIMGELQDLELFIEKDADPLMEIVKNKFREDMEVVRNVMEVQIITPTKSRGRLSAKKINEEIQKIYNPSNGDYILGRDKVKIFINDKIINLKNNYNSKDEDDKPRAVYNGSIGTVVKIEKNYCVVNFAGIGKVVVNKNDYENINLAYAISCHSSQGSQWERVIGAIDMSAYMLLNVEILYTLITRASEHCSLAIEKQAMGVCLSNVEQNTKQTLLPMFLSLIEPKNVSLS